MSSGPAPVTPRMGDMRRANVEGDEPNGCFSYHHEAESRTIRFHFGNRDTSGHAPISTARRPERLRELTRMFADMREEVPEAPWVCGRSWMYNLPSYRRLFPPEYGRGAEPTEP